MTLTIDMYTDKSIKGSLDIQVDNYLKAKLHRVYQQPTFVFINKFCYNKLPKENRDSITTMDSNTETEMTVEEILATDVMFILTSKENNNIDEFVDLVQQYTGEELKYLVVDY